MPRNKRDGRSSYKLLTRIFDKGIWALVAGFFAILTIIAFVGGSFADKYSANLNTIFDIKTQDIIGGGEEYYSSDYYKKNGYDNDAMRAHSLEIAEQAAAEGAVLLWNNKLSTGENALPISSGNKVSLFGVATQKYLVAGGGSGYVGINTNDTVKSKLEEKGVAVNPKLWNAYNVLKANYGYYVVENEAKDRVGDANYWEYRIREIPWTTIDSSTFGKVTDTVSEYGDAAIMTVTRYTSEDGDTDFDASYDYGKNIYNDENFDGNYMDLSKDENNVLEELIKLKRSGQVKRVVLLINTASPLQMKNIKNLDIDACIWVGMGGSASYAQIADVLTGDIAPSGHLADTIAYDHYSSPVMANFGDYTYGGDLSGLPATNKMTHNTKYLVYQEGIYMGYRYYETRYEDAVMGKGGADGVAGVTAGNEANGWKYSDEVAYPFGYGLTYTNFSYSGFKVEQKGDDYEVSLTIKNEGSVAGKDVMQVYLQKPYTDYDKQTGVEKSAVELVGFDKTDAIAPGKTQTLTVTVKGEDFKTYDSYGKRTYILEEGDYYLSVGTSAHDALNNILALKGYNSSNGMTDVLGKATNGRSDLAYRKHIDNDDFEKYARSSATGYAITNRFDNADIKIYDGTKNQVQDFKYLSRNDWQGTYPTGVTLQTNTVIVKDMQYGMDVPVKVNDKIPVYETVTVAQEVLDALNADREEDKKQDKLVLINLMDKDFNDPLWNDLINQMSWTEQNMLLTYGYCRIAGISNIGSREIKANDGPAGIKGNICSGLKSYMCFPSQQLLAATWNTPLVNKVGDAFGMEMLHAGYTAIYGPGAGIHRSAFSGRNFEYYSEDGFISGKMFAAETQGLQSRGVIVFAKHMVLNDAERNRYGVATFANEQAIREIYLRAFEGGVVEGKANGIMTSHNRIGCIWAGGHSGLLTDVLRKEWGFTGITITDAAVSDHEFNARAMASAVVAGQDLWMHGGLNNAWDSYKSNATVAQAMREACHRILYNQLHSNGMNNVTADTEFRDITPWWKIALTAVQVVSVTVLCIAAVMAIAGFVFGTRAFEKMYVAKVDGTYVYPYEREKGFKGFFVNIGRGFMAMPYRNRVITVVVCSVAIVAILTAIIVPVSVNAYRNRPIPPVPPIPRETYAFEAEDNKVKLGPGTDMNGNTSLPYAVQEAGAEEAYIGNISRVVGATVTFYIKAEKAAVAELIISVSQNNRYSPLLGAITVIINGEMIDESGRDSTINFEDDESWVKFCDVSLGDIELKEGLNTIQLMQISESRGNNINRIKLDSTAPLALVTEPSSYGDDDWTRTEMNIGIDGHENDCVTIGAPAFFSTEDYKQGYAGNVSGNVGAFVSFEVNVDADCEAVLYMCVSVREKKHGFADAYKLTVNDEEIEVSAEMPYGGNNWTTFSYVGLGKINLEAARTNLIKIEIIADPNRNDGKANSAYGANISGIALTVDGLSVTGIKHECGHICPECGLCRDIDCNKVSCADKCEEVLPKHACTSVCPDCGGCINPDCEEEVCADKCDCKTLNDEAWAVYTFNAVDGGSLHEGVTMKNGSMKGGPLSVNSAAGGYIGGIARNNGAEITFEIYAANACTATVYLNLSKRPGTFVLNDAYRLIVNGVDYPSRTDLSTSQQEWEQFELHLVRHVNLDKGNNTIVVQVIDTKDVGANFKGLVFKTESTSLTWKQSTVVAFDAVTDGALSSGVTTTAGKNGNVSVNSNGYLGMIAMNEGATITFNIHADAAGTAKLIFTVAERDRADSFVFDDAYKLTVNGVDVACDADMTRSGSGWESFRDYLLGEITLEEGDNTITVTVIDTAELGSNIKGIKLDAAGLALTWA